MTREVAIGKPFERHMDALSEDEQEQVLELLEHLQVDEDLDDLIDDTDVRPPHVEHRTFGEDVFVTWSKTSLGVAVGMCGRFRAPPSDMP